jgi:FlaA1/EpsC-like NDP-sugar epimerase
MGATKRLAELILQAFAAKNTRKGSTKFCMVRFGNVLGSSGSVIPLFRSQIKNGGPVTLTHPDITRYFMSIAEASQLVIQAGAMSYGGDVFVLDMGEPVKIKSLAETLIRLSGLSVKSEDNPNGDIEIIATKLRPGEKLYEELLVGTDTKSTEHPRILRANEISMPYDELEKYLNKLKDACSNFEYELISCLLLSANLSYSPSEGLKDALFMERNIT